MTSQDNNVLSRYSELLRFLVSGGVAFLVNLGVLYAFTEVFRVWYLVSSVIAFLITFIVSFIIQKNWTFKNKGLEGVTTQIGMSLIMAIINLGLNTTMMYVFVDHAHIHYLTAQVVATGFIAIETYFIYKFIIFKSHNNQIYS